MVMFLVVMLFSKCIVNFELIGGFVMVHGLGSFSEIIKKLRKKAGLNQHELAKALGVHQQTVSRWEKGALPRKDMFVKILMFFNVDHDVLSSLSIDDQQSDIGNEAEIDERYLKIKNRIDMSDDERSIEYQNDIDELSSEFERLAGASFIHNPQVAWVDFYNELLKSLESLTLDLERRKAIPVYKIPTGDIDDAIIDIKKEFVDKVAESVYKLLVRTTMYDVIIGKIKIGTEDADDCEDDDNYVPH